MFSSNIVWKGIVYTALMMLGKLLCGIWLVRLPLSIPDVARSTTSLISDRAAKVLRRIKHDTQEKHNESTELQQNQGANERDQSQGPPAESELRVPHEVGQTQGQSHKPTKPLSIYPSGIISFAMVARGEIGFLISSVAESKGIFRPQDSAPEGVSEIFLIVTWAIVLCTIIGPVCVGLLVRRVRKLEKERTESQIGRNHRDVLGVWGVQ
jgi:hypothetical protein